MIMSQPAVELQEPLQEAPTLQPLIAAAEAGRSKEHAVLDGNVNRQTMEEQHGVDKDVLCSPFQVAFMDSNVSHPARRQQVDRQLTSSADGDTGCNTTNCLAECAQPGPLHPQIFISHTGQNTAGCTFAASILKPALEAAGLSVFMDFASLEPGCQWPEELVHAAANSAVVVVVLTKEYTQRYWCMLELSLALHSRRLAAIQQQQQAQQQQQQQPLVIPVFYDEVNEVMRTSDVVNYWQEAGSQQVPAHRMGWVDPSGWADNIRTMVKLQALRRHTLQASKDQDYQLARHVVAAAVKAMPVRMHVDETYGFEEQEADLAAELAVPDPDRLGLWLHGMGGSGKTTMATLLHNRLSPSFQHTAFITLQPDEHIVSQHLTSVLKQLGARDFNEDSPVEVLLWTFQGYIVDKRVLIVVDNVWRAGQLDKLLPRKFGQGSRIIITSRSSSLPDSLWWRKVGQQLLQHHMLALSDEAAMQLLHASANLAVDLWMPYGLHDAESELITACRGLPLALQLTGASLYCEKRNAPQPEFKWKAALAALQRGSNAVDSDGRLKDILYTTFVSLETAQQHMLLDVATVLQGQSTKLALVVWDAWHGQYASLLFEDLERRNLLSTDNGGNLQMHDVTAALGRRLLRDDTGNLPEKLRGSRLWVQDGKLQGYQKGKPVLAAQLGYLAPSCESSESSEHAKVAGLEELQLSDLSKAKIMLMGETCLPLCGQQTIQLGQVLWLRTTSPARLDYQSCGTLINLRILQLMGCNQLSTLPDFIGKLAALQQLDLSYSRQLSTVPESIGWLTALQRLDLSYCRQLSALPESIGRLTGLQKLDLIGCVQLSTLPESIGHLTAMRWLELSYCRQLSTLPTSIGKLKRPQQLNLRGCVQLSALPESLGQMNGLHNLDLRSCEQLRTVPESVGQLTGLQSLNLHGCGELKALPASIGQLMRLRNLFLGKCMQCNTLPKSLWQLTGLQRLDLSFWEKLRALPESVGQLIGLQELKLTACKSLITLPEALGQLTELLRLLLGECVQLSALPESVGQLTTLQELDFSYCMQLSTLPESIGRLTGLQLLDLSYCRQLNTLPQSIGQMTGLHRLYLICCGQLSTLPESVGQLTGLQRLDLSGCGRLSTLPESTGQLLGLQELDLFDCQQLRALPESMGQLKGLLSLKLHGCEQLSTLPECIGRLTQLRIVGGTTNTH